MNRGDVVQLAAGDSIPGDSRILEASGLEVDESSVTGESMPVVKSEAATASPAVADRTSMLWEGTSIAAGSVTAVVVATGADSESGRAQVVEDTEASRTGVEARLRDLTRITVPVSLAGGLSLTVAGLLRRIPLRETLQSGVSLAVAAVPEGLPMLARILAVRHGFKCTVLFPINPADGTIDPNNQTNIVGMEALKTADMLVMQLRFREMPDDQMKYFVDYLNSAKPILAIRT